jgi:uncharacterized protein (TIGR02145 family)
MQNRIWFYTLIILGLIFLNKCEKEKEITDADGNVYNTVTIGTQVWMKENLKTTRYSNGDLIGTTNPATLDISSESTPKYQWAYAGDEGNVANYGRLYTWYAITDSRKVCPTGWHVPAYAEWYTLIDYLVSNDFGYEGDGYDIAKSIAATSGWTLSGAAGSVGNDQTSNNSSSFTAYPSGYRILNGTFNYIGLVCFWWSTPESYSFYLVYDKTYMDRADVEKYYGLSVRCVKD